MIQQRHHFARSRSLGSATQAIRHFDAAPYSVITESVTIRSQSRKAQIMATDRSQFPQAAESTAAHNTSRHRPWRWRYALIPAVAAAGLLAAIVAPNSPTLPPAQAGLATWTRQAQPLTGDRLEATSRACQAAIGSELFEGHGAANMLNEPSEAYDLVAAEVRGDWATLVFAKNGHGLSCLAWLGRETPMPALWDLPRGGSWSRGEWAAQVRKTSNAIIGTLDNQVAEPNDPHGSEVNLLGASEVEFLDGTGFTAVFGRVGPDVQSVTLHTITMGDVATTVENGWFVAWWPGLWGGPNTYWGPFEERDILDEDLQVTGIDESALGRYRELNGTDIIDGYTVTDQNGSEAVTANWRIEDCSSPACSWELPANAQLWEPEGTESSITLITPTPRDG